MTNGELGKALKRERVRKGISAKDLSDEVDCHVSNIFKIEEGHVPSLLLADRLLRALEVKLTIGRVEGRRKLDLDGAA